MAEVISGIQLGSKTAAALALQNPVLLLGQPAIETDTRKIKIGDGATAYNDLEYANVTPEELTAALATIDLSDYSTTLEMDAAIAAAIATIDLSSREPVIAEGTAAQYWNGLKAWVDFATSVRASVLTGLSTATNAVITATDTVLSALGKLQAQINANTASLLTKVAATTGDITTATDNVKYLTSSSWAWIKTQPAQWVLSAFSGTGNRLMQVSSAGAVSATLTVEDGFEVDLDIIAAIEAAVYPSSSARVNIAPSGGKVFKQGKWYESGPYLYFATLDNTVKRLGSDVPTVQVGTTTYQLISKGTFNFDTATLCTATLPLSAAATVGDTIIGHIVGAGGVRVAQNASQSIKWHNGTSLLSSTAGATGYFEFTAQGSNFEIVYTGNNTWDVRPFTGAAPTIV